MSNTFSNQVADVVHIPMSGENTRRIEVVRDEEVIAENGHDSKGHALPLNCRRFTRTTRSSKSRYASSQASCEVVADHMVDGVMRTHSIRNTYRSVLWSSNAP